MGSPSISASLVRVGTPSRTRHTSVLVPPMSRVMTSLQPERSACRMAPITPAAGPENRAVMALSAMPLAGSRPPFDCIRLNRPVNDRASSSRWNSRRYRSMIGWT